MKRIIIRMVLVFVLVLGARVAFACESCTIARLGKERLETKQEPDAKKVYFEYLYEQKDWKKMNAQEAHEWHHDGHHIHLRSTEELFHFKLGGQIHEDLHVFADLPYVVRNTIEIEDHDRVGQREVSKGLGDLNIIGDYRFWKKSSQSLNGALGVKLPTGETRRLNSVGQRFEAELQPGTGSIDYLVGAIYRYDGPRSSITANTSYVYKNEGAQDFKGSNVVTAALFSDYLVSPQSAHFKFYPGIDLVYQYETRQEDGGVKIADSGGTTILSGPSIKVRAHDRISVLGSLLFPAYQNLGGIHQELRMEWHLGGQLTF